MFQVYAQPSSGFPLAFLECMRRSAFVTAPTFTSMSKTGRTTMRPVTRSDGYIITVHACRHDA